MPFADELVNDHTARSLTRAVHTAMPGAELASLRAAGQRLGPLALRERADLLRDALLADVPGDYAELARVVRAARDGAPAFGGWLIWPVTSAIATKAVTEDTEDAFDDAMALLADLTGRLTSEFALRVLLRHDVDRGLGIIAGWTVSPDADVRRLASEGTRPYLPWSLRVPALIARPGATVPVLDALYADASEYVRRSVANHLNDLSRDHADLVVATARRWLDDPAPTTGRLVRHGLRTLVKRGHADALELLGFAPATLEVDGPVLDHARVAFGGNIRFTATIRNAGTEEARLAIDYVIHHNRANGSQSARTFKLTTRTLAPGETMRVSREHSFRPITTRRYHPGPHAVALQINGVASARAGFELQAP
ncbi:DNA alkylation repair protein [Streptomyces sp. GC420]|uniref:DNA alkylation repair protein n=1 Tax=Streptomyces sp. GC420 TaxID=2697568 RepID=UPI001414FF9D|nr:DNA alkylation repair protein [Streptomyces sp. GC420]NBM15926.1 DNA alkylation repair protein [Streptomyces sp. GC420]